MPSTVHCLDNQNCKLYTHGMANIAVKRSPKNAAQFNWSLCIILLGDSGTGKTSLVEQFVGRKEKGNKFMPVEEELERKGYKITLEIRDTAGMERYRSLTKSHYKGAHGALLVFDVTNEDSFNHIHHWYDDLKTYSSQDQILTSLLVGTRCHKTSERTVSERSAKSFADNNDMDYLEVSIEHGVNVQECFNHVIDNILEQMEKKHLHRFEIRSQSQESGAKLYFQNCSNCCGYIRQGSETNSVEKVVEAGLEVRV